MWDECVFNKIKQEAQDTYLVHTRCEAQSEGEKRGIGKFWEENLQYQIVDGYKLVVTTKPHTPPTDGELRPIHLRMFRWGRMIFWPKMFRRLRPIHLRMFRWGRVIFWPKMFRHHITR